MVGIRLLLLIRIILINNSVNFILYICVLDAQDSGNSQCSIDEYPYCLRDMNVYIEIAFSNGLQSNSNASPHHIYYYLRILNVPSIQRFKRLYILCDLIVSYAIAVLLLSHGRFYYLQSYLLFRVQREYSFITDTL